MCKVEKDYIYVGFIKQMVTCPIILKIDYCILFLEIIEEIHHNCAKPLAILSYSYIKSERLWQGNTSLPEVKKCETVLRKQVCKDEIQQHLNNLEDIYFWFAHVTFSIP